MNTPAESFHYERSLKSVSSYPFLHKYIPVDRYIVRPPASLIVRAVFPTSVTPNQLTLASFFLALVAGAVFATGRPAGFALGGCLAMVSAIFDNADGMLARAKGLTSRYGAFLDLFLDRIADFAVLTGVTFGIYRSTADPRVLALGLVTTGLYLLQVSLYYLNNIYLGVTLGGEGAEAKNLAVFVVLVFSLAGWPLGILFAVFAMASLGTVIKLVRFLRRGRDPESDPGR